MWGVGLVDWSAAAFFDLSGWEWVSLFDAGEPVWAALARLPEAVAERVGGGTGPRFAGAFFEGPVAVGKGVVVEPGAYVKGPAWIGDGASIRQGAYLRGGVVVGEGCTVGHCTELKNAILLPGAAAPHFNYVGDSVLGRRVNLGAGTILSNVPLARGEVRVRCGRERVATGLSKFGAILGDGSQTGCNAVLNPGTVAGRDCRFYPGVSAAGYFPAGAVVSAPVTRCPEGGDS